MSTEEEAQEYVSQELAEKFGSDVNVGGSTASSDPSEVTQLLCDSNFLVRVAPAKVTAPYDRATHGVQPLLAASVRHSPQLPHHIYAAFSHMQQPDDKCFDIEQPDMKLSGENRPLTVFKVCQALQLRGKGNAVRNDVALVCTIVKHCYFPLSPAIGIDEVAGVLYIAFANAPDPQAQTVEERRAQYVVLETYPISYKLKPDAKLPRQMIVDKAGVKKYVARVEARYPVRLFIRPDNGQIIIWANKSASVIKPDCEPFLVSELDETCGRFSLTPIDLPEQKVTEGTEYRRLEMDYSQSPCFMSATLNRLYCYSCPALEANGAPLSSTETPDLPFLIEFNFDSTTGIKLNRLVCDEVDAAVEFLYANLQALTQRPAEPDHKQQLRRSIYLVGVAGERVVFGFKVMPNLYAVVPVADRTASAGPPRLIGSTRLHEALAAFARQPASALRHNFGWIEPDGRLYLWAFKQAGEETQGALLTRALIN